MKQTIEIEVPEGKKAIYKDNKIIFEDEFLYESIKTVGDAINYLKNNHICPNIIDSYERIPYSSFEHKIISYRAVVAAITNNEQRHLTTGERWFPSIEICSPGKLKNCLGDTILGRIKSEGEEFEVVGGGACYGAAAGFLCFYSAVSVSDSYTRVGFRSVGSREAALYISKQFGKLLFEVSCGGVNCDWEWVSK